MIDNAVVVGMLRVKNEARWIERCLQSMRPVCKDIVLFDDHSTDQTRELAAPLVSEVIESPFPVDALNESRDKDCLLSAALKYKPDWILCIDGDEEIEASGGTKIRRWVNQVHAARESISAFQFRVLYFWNDLNHVRLDGVYRRFCRPSLFRIRDENVGKLRFNITGGANLHCSNFPQGLRWRIWQSDVVLYHYGYVDPDVRQRKYEWYNKVDPENANEDGYRHIIELPSKHAPGPVEIVPFKEGMRWW